MEDVKTEAEETVHTAQAENTFENTIQEEEVPEAFDSTSDADNDDINAKIVAATRLVRSDQEVNSQVGVNKQSVVGKHSTGDGFAMGRKETSSVPNVEMSPSTSRSTNKQTRQRKRRYHARTVIPRESKMKALSMIRTILKKGKSHVAPVGVFPKRKKRSVQPSKKQVLRSDFSSNSSHESTISSCCRDCGCKH